VIPGSSATATVRRLLTELGESGRTGALHVGGTPGGVFYLVAGRIAYAESPAAPSLAERLIGSGRLSPQTWRTAYAEGHLSCEVGRVLLRDGVLGRHELAQRVVAAIAGATHVLLRQADAPARFVPGERHWLGEVTPALVRALPGVIPRPRRPRNRNPATGP
jgi:hypothetical protein